MEQRKKGILCILMRASYLSMSLSAKYRVDLRNLLNPSTPKNRMFFGLPSKFALANLFKLGSISTSCWELKIFSNLFLSTLRIGSFAARNLPPIENSVIIFLDTAYWILNKG